MKFLNKIKQMVKEATSKVKGFLTPKTKANKAYEETRAKVNRKFEAELKDLTKSQKDFIDKTGIPTFEPIPADALSKAEVLKRTGKMKETLIEVDSFAKAINLKVDLFLHNLSSGFGYDESFETFIDEFKAVEEDVQLQFMEMYQEELQEYYEQWKDGLLTAEEFERNIEELKSNLSVILDKNK